MRINHKSLRAFAAGFAYLCRQPLGALGLVIVVIILGGALLAEYLVLADPVKLSIRDKFLAPSLAHPFGTDYLGRDVYSRVVAGSRIAMTAALVAISVSAKLTAPMSTDG